MKIRIEFDNTNELLAFNYAVIPALASGKGSFDISVNIPDIPELNDICDCYHSGYCWGTKELDKCDCGGRKSRCTFYKKGL